MVYNVCPRHTVTEKSVINSLERALELANRYERHTRLSTEYSLSDSGIAEMAVTNSRKNSARIRITSLGYHAPAFLPVTKCMSDSSCFIECNAKPWLIRIYTEPHGLIFKKRGQRYLLQDLEIVLGQGPAGQSRCTGLQRGFAPHSARLAPEFRETIHGVWLLSCSTWWSTSQAAYRMRTAILFSSSSISAPKPGHLRSSQSKVFM